MKKTLFLLIVLAVVGFVYWQQTQTKEVIETPDQPTVEIAKVDVTKVDYPLDSLLQFDSESALAEVYGQEHISRKKGYYPEGMGEYMMTLLFEGKANEVAFAWSDDTLSFNGLQAVKVMRDSSDWADQNGVHVGMTLKELEAVNGHPFNFYGFGWDYSGLTSFEEGVLKDKKAFVTMGLKEEAYQDESNLALLGDHEMSSSDDIAQKVNPIVVELTLRKAEKE